MNTQQKNKIKKLEQEGIITEDLAEQLMTAKPSDLVSHGVAAQGDDWVAPRDAWEVQAREWECEFSELELVTVSELLETL
jgi:hypothetical protein